jgi:hypothetical protein
MQDAMVTLSMVRRIKFATSVTVELHSRAGAPCHHSERGIYWHARLPVLLCVLNRASVIQTGRIPPLILLFSREKAAGLVQKAAH